MISCRYNSTDFADNNKRRYTLTKKIKVRSMISRTNAIKTSNVESFIPSDLYVCLCSEVARVK